MSHTNYDAIGALSLNTLTPVIKALFGGFDLEPTSGAEASIRLIVRGETAEATWADVLKRLEHLCGEESLFGDIFRKRQVGAWKVLSALARRFKVSEATMLAFADRQEFAGDAPLESLFWLAQRCDDGHGLRAVKLEGVMRSDWRQRLGATAHTVYVSADFSIERRGQQDLALATQLHKAVRHLDFSSAAAALVHDIASRLNGIADDAVRVELWRVLAWQLLDESVKAKFGPLSDTEKSVREILSDLVSEATDRGGGDGEIVVSKATFFRLIRHVGWQVPGALLQTFSIRRRTG